MSMVDVLRDDRALRTVFKAARAAAGVSQEQCGVRRTVGRFESGDDVSLFALCQMARAVGLRLALVPVAVPDVTHPPAKVGGDE